MLSSLLVDQSGSALELSYTSLLLCMTTSIIMGLLIAGVHMYKNTYSKNFVVTLAVLPILVQLIIMLVNGNLGTGVAVMGAFSLIRFRSVAGGAREITSIFWSMGVGLATGMGYIGYVIFFSIVTGALILVLNQSKFGENNPSAERNIRITIAENLDYPDLFTDILNDYTHSHQFQSVKTTNMGSLYELSFRVLLKNTKDEKNLIDAFRVRNGNLPITSAKVSSNKDEL